MKLKAAIFDMDGTLVDSLSYWDMTWKKLGERFLGIRNFKPAEEVDAHVRTLLIRDTAAFINEQYHLSADEETLYRFLDDSVPAYYREKATLKDGVVPLLRFFRDNGIKLCIASATDQKYLRPVLEQFGIASFFSPILSCSTLGVGKDQPDIYLKALEALGTAPAETVLFEDSLVALRTGNRLGLLTVGVYDQYNFHQELLEKESAFYVAKGHTMEELIPRFASPE